MAGTKNPFEALFKQMSAEIIKATKSHYFATVTSVTTGGIGLSIDGDTSGVKKFTCNRGEKFASGDRVLVAKESGTYVVICKIGSPGGPVAKTSEMTQAVGVDSNGALWTTPGGGGSGSTSRIYKSGSTTEYIEFNADGFVPSRRGNSVSPGPSLGTSTYAFGDCYLGYNGALNLGSVGISRIGFFGKTPVGQQTLSTTTQNMSYMSANSSNYLIVLNNLVGILMNQYGLIK